LGIGDRVTILPPVTQTELAAFLHTSDAVLAPLTINDRNVVQGCCPLKILEGMAAGVPVIASDLPVVRELGSAGVHFLLVKPGSVDQLAEAALRLWSDKAIAKQIGEQARAHGEANYTWERSGAALVAAYRELGIQVSASRRLSIV
jgi:glycosyltransferase involved in cell wall biosynthesis